MDHHTFEVSCKHDGFDDVEEKHGPPGHTAPMHAHPFSVRVLVLSGEFRIDREGGSEVFHAGGSFSMEAGCEHAESFGPKGATYLVARKHVAR